MAKKGQRPLRGVVYSTEQGRMCPHCGRPTASCDCSDGGHHTPSPSGPVLLHLETKSRRGKSVTVIRNVPLPPDERKLLAARLRKTCGAGGAVRDNAVEIQGDHREEIAALLRGMGWTVRRAT